jgi:hypothetical protein
MREHDYTIPEWCAKHRVCRASFYNLEKRGKAPVTIKIGNRRRITPDSDREWVAEQEAAASTERGWPAS